MRRYFINPELRKSTAALLILNMFFMMVVLLNLKMYHYNLKQDYVRTFGAVTERISTYDPEIAREIIPVITAGADEKEAQKGKYVLEQYGLSGKLENKLFPYINNSAHKENLNVILIFVVMGSIFLLMNYLQYSYFYDRIRRLNTGAKKIIDGDYDISISEDREGDFSKLSTSFNSMREIIRNNLQELKKEKQFLVELLSDISHQLKTPLSSMIVYNDILLNKQLSKEQSRNFLIDSRNQLYRMNWLIKSILKLARFDARAIEFHRESQSLNETIKYSIEALEEKIKSAGIQVKLHENGKIMFSHDRHWLCEALINIIKNCVEHTQKGGRVDVCVVENPIYKRIVISDNGEGIDEKDLPNIFKRFYKARTSKSSDSIGIGLALSKSILEAHGGSINVQSKLGVGSTFRITFLKY
ncbi:HAMP domain-containing sensor histidine kinase [Clostridium luticellarii]|jgi:signal transduction histidine kinase|uniref:histidine kinase n=1 Tax=Clostridium luticellarii TaxID=1691940 RepID=A0A2T0BF64_9CLOT|nr:HAMP domain-containing sensor histidine kinase [Clostridium luticellarii]MCI1945694.1 HAMP domain-containing histidine kinase [Clostridium luticellarii]MCI1969053.1 HAMP domain-containing histidine kinase [Clostridium luticellarii]MCI1996065.1 HAMP domain-containing histidine kinase [Clostridium luticellarii]MCI2040448.1 HAMP domain-containing histidine kinase [Clostridium luticellarii]PRR82463.1 Alkaline phosphatase synthesis sensor protein PhoR [Clostridium luticellarii]